MAVVFDDEITDIKPQKASRIVFDDELPKPTIKNASDLIPNEGASSSILERIGVLAKETAYTFNPSLKATEGVLRASKMILDEGIGNIGKEAGIGLTKGFLGIPETQAQGMNYLGRLLKVTDEKIKPLVDLGIISPLKAKTAKLLSDNLITYGEKFTKHWQGEKAFLDKFRDKETWEGTFTDNFSISRTIASVTESVPMFVVGALGGAVSGSAWLGASLLGTSEGLGVFQEALDKGKTDVRALTVGTIAGATSTVSEMVFGSLTNIISPNATNVLNSMWKEATQEGGQQIVTNLIRQIGIDDTIGLFEGLAESVIVGGLTGGAMTGVANTFKKRAVVKAQKTLTPEQFNQAVSLVENTLKENSEGINKALETHVDDFVQAKDKEAEEQRAMAEQPQEEQLNPVEEYSPDEQPLIAEARKYKTAEEFVASQFKSKQIDKKQTRELAKIQEDALDRIKELRKKGLDREQIENDSIYKRLKKEEKENLTLEEENIKEAVKEAENVFGFTDKMTNLQKGKTRDALKKQVIINGNANTRKQHAFDMIINKGSTVGETPEGRGILHKDGGYLTEKQVTKTLVDYAEFLQNTKSQLTDIWNKTQELKTQANPVKETIAPQKGDKVTKLAKREAENLFKKYDIKIEKDDLTKYEIQTNEEQLNRTMKEFDKDSVKANLVALGLEEPKKGILPTSYYVIAEKLAIKNKDIDMLQKLATQSAISTEASKAGQLIQILSNVEADSPVRAVQEVAKVRTENFNKVNKEKADITIKKEKKKIKQTIDEAYNELDLEINDFIKSLEC